MFGRRAARRLRLVGFPGLAFWVSCAAWFVTSAARAEPTAGFPEPEAPTPAPAPAPTAPSEPAPAPPSTPRAPVPAAPSRSAAPRAQPRELPSPEPAPSAVSSEPAPSSAFPLLLPYRQGMPVPPGYHVESRPATGLLATGSLALGAGYVFAVITAANNDFKNGSGWLFVPVIGPWAAIGAREFHCRITTVDPVTTATETQTCVRAARHEAVAIATMAVDGMLEITGTVVTVAGMLSGHDELARNGTGQDLHVSVSGIGSGGLRLWLDGRF